MSTIVILEDVLRTVGFSPVCRGWITTMYRDVYSVVKLNGHLSELTSIKRSIRLICIFFSSPATFLFYVGNITAEDNFKDFKDHPLELDHGRIVSAYADVTRSG